MRKIILCLFVVFFSMANAQLKVKSNGDVQIRDSLSVNAPLAIKAKNSDSYCAYFYGANAKSIYVNNLAPYSSVTKNGIYVYNPIEADRSYKGVMIDSYGASLTNKEVWGIHSIAGGSTLANYGVLGCLRNPQTATNGFAVFGSVMPVAFAESYQGIYAGFFYGDVRVTGTLYATLLTPSSNLLKSSEEGTSQSLSVVNNEEEGVSQKLQQVQLLKFRRDDMRGVNTPENNKSLLKKQISDVINDDLVEDTYTDIPQTKLSSVKYGLAADQLKNVFPELVYEDKNGNVSINYIEIIPLLVQSINELSNRIKLLENEKEKLYEEINKATLSSNSRCFIIDNDSDNLYTEQELQLQTLSEMLVTVPDDVKQANLCVYDMSGTQVYSKIVSNTNGVYESLSAANLQHGKYLFSLVVDGQITCTKKFIIR